MKSKLLKQLAFSMLMSFVVGKLSLSGKAQTFPFPQDFDPTDIPLFIMERMGVDFEAEGIDIEQLRPILRERMAERFESGEFPAGMPFSGDMPFPSFGRSGNMEPNKLGQVGMPSILERIRGLFEISDDDEWALVKSRIEAVLRSKREVAAGEMNVMSLMMRSESKSGSRAQLAGRLRTPEQRVLQKAIESEASPDELKKALGNFNNHRDKKRLKLEEAQQNLREVLTVRQEAIATVSGLL